MKNPSQTARINTILDAVERRLTEDASTTWLTMQVLELAKCMVIQMDAMQSQIDAAQPAQEQSDADGFSGRGAYGINPNRRGTTDRSEL